jgi:hypothetical protein
MRHNTYHSPPLFEISKPFGTFGFEAKEPVILINKMAALYISYYVMVPWPPLAYFMPSTLFDSYLIIPLSPIAYVEGGDVGSKAWLAKLQQLQDIDPDVALSQLQAAVPPKQLVWLGGAVPEEYEEEAEEGPSS